MTQRKATPSRKVSRCAKCRYNLQGITTDRCPECGKPIDQPPFYPLHKRTLIIASLVFVSVSVTMFYLAGAELSLWGTSSTTAAAHEWVLWQLIVIAYLSMVVIFWCFLHRLSRTPLQS